MGGKAAEIAKDTSEVFFLGVLEIRRELLELGLLCFKRERELLGLARWDADNTWQKGCAQIRTTACV